MFGRFASTTTPEKVRKQMNRNKKRTEKGERERERVREGERGRERVRERGELIENFKHSSENNFE